MMGFYTRSSYFGCLGPGTHYLLPLGLMDAHPGLAAFLASWQGPGKTADQSSQSLSPQSLQELPRALQSPRRAPKSPPETRPNLHSYLLHHEFPLSPSILTPLKVPP